MQKSLSCLIHPAVDFLMVGGLSFIALCLCFLFGWGSSEAIGVIGWYFFIGSFVVNFPHFSVSYQIFYGDHRKRITSNWLWFSVGILIPGGLILYSTICYYSLSIGGITILVHAMFLLVGWHYIKQIFGCVVVLSSVSNYTLSSKQRLCLKLNLYAMWSLSLFFNNKQLSTYHFNTIPYTTYGLSAQWSYLSFTFVGITLLGFFYFTYSKYTEDKKIFPINALVALGSIYIWYIPVFYHPGFVLMIPLFHSLQYLLFVFAYKKNKYKEKKHKYSMMISLFLFMSLAIVLGILFMEFLPRGIDFLFTSRVTSFTLCLALFNVIINIHHYFIDHLIWRRDIGEVQRYLFGK